MTTFMEAFSLWSVHRTNESRTARSRLNLHFRDRQNELAPPIPNECILLHDFLLEIRWQKQQIIRSCALDLIRRLNSDVRSGQELVVLMGIAIVGIVAKD